MKLIFICSFLLVLNIQCAVVPKIVHGVNEIFSSIKDSMADAFRCMSISRPPTLADVKFYLFTPKMKNYPEEIVNLDVNKTKNYNHDFKTKILIHGYTMSYKNEHFIKMKDAMGSVNVIMVNWENLAFTPCYPIAADYANFVGQLFGYLLERLNAEKVHIIGFSLGAHIAGLGAQMQPNKVLRITGLDPAGPMFFNIPTNNRLDKADAQNVDVIHTSHIGIGSSSGHADFFVNGGKVQPGCSTTDLSCSHRRSLELYLESITSNVSFKAIICDSLNDFENDKCSNNTYTLMGEPWLVDGAQRGKFYLRTNSIPLYALKESHNTTNTTTSSSVTQISISTATEKKLVSMEKLFKKTLK